MSIEMAGQLIGFSHSWFGPDCSDIGDDEFWAGVEEVEVQYEDENQNYHSMKIKVTDPLISSIRTFKNLFETLTNYCGNDLSSLAIVDSHDKHHHNYIPAHTYRNSNDKTFAITYSSRENRHYSKVINLIQYDETMFYVYAEYWDYRDDGPSSLFQNHYFLGSVYKSGLSLNALRGMVPWKYNYCVDGVIMDSRYFNKLRSWRVENPDLPVSWGVALLDIDEDLVCYGESTSWSYWPRSDEEKYETSQHKSKSLGLLTC